MKIKLKNGVVLSNNWKACGCSAEDWADLNSGKSIEVSSISKLIENDVDVTGVTSKIKEKKQGGNK
jgi:hypothetical protein